MNRRRRPPVPVVIVITAALGIAFVAIPMVGLLLRAPWSQLASVATADATLRALWLSVVTSLVAASLATAFGTGIGWWIAERPGRATRITRALVTVALVSPPVVAGVALFSAYGRRGLVGRWWYDWFGWQLPFTAAAVVMAQTFVALPFVVLTVDSALAQRDATQEEAARTLGASPSYTLWHVTLPAIRPAMAAGAVLAWARALGEFGATITFAGNLPGTTQTMPLLVYLDMQNDPDRAIMLAVVLGAISLTVLLALRDRWWGGRGVRR